MWDDFISAFLDSLLELRNKSKPRSKFDIGLTVIFTAFFLFIIVAAIYNNFLK
jgi:hypothetical protein